MVADKGGNKIRGTVGKGIEKDGAQADKERYISGPLTTVIPAANFLDHLHKGYFDSISPRRMTRSGPLGQRGLSLEK